MKNYIILFLFIVVVVGTIVYLYTSKENYINYSFIDEAHQINDVQMYPSFVLDKANREERDKLIQDESGILKKPKSSKMLRGVDELMAVKYASDNIYDATSVNSDKIHTHNLTHW